MYLTACMADAHHFTQNVQKQNVQMIVSAVNTKYPELQISWFLLMRIKAILHTILIMLLLKRVFIQAKERQLSACLHLKPVQGLWLVKTKSSLQQH